MSKSKKNYTIGFRGVRWFCLLSIFLCIVLYFKINLNHFYGSEGDHFIEGYFVNTLGCHMLALNPFSKTALSLLEVMEPMKCTGIQLLEAKTIHGENYLLLAMSKEQVLRVCHVTQISDVYCEYRLIKRVNDNANKYSSLKRFRLKDGRKQTRLKSGATIIRIQCYGAHNLTVYNDVHFFVPIPPKLATKTAERDRLSAMIIGIDSISHMHFLRTMPLLAAHIEGLPHVEFWGYNRVGRNTYPNLVPLFSGLNDTELEDVCYKGQWNYDKCDFIWKHFKEAGYNTSYAEDTFVGGTFNYGKWGFSESPTDFYLRPVMLEIDRFTRYSIDEQEDIHCTGNRKYADILYEFIYKMIPQLKDGSHFSFFWQSQGVHDYFSYPQLLDKDYLKLLNRLESDLGLNDTIVFLMSDHGLRYGSFRSTYQGMLEESQPLLIAIYPKWLEDTYPLALTNLKKNAHNLVTTFDLHETLKDLTKLELLNNIHIINRSLILKSLGQDMPRGISLFLPIPETRSCKSAGIPSSFCLCQTFSPIDTTDERSDQAAQFVVQSINTWLSSFDQCQPLRLVGVHEAYLLDRNNIQQDTEIKVRVQTSPGGGQFEGTVRFVRDYLVLNGPILRTNKYGNQSHCVTDYHIEMYCYCK